MTIELWLIRSGLTLHLAENAENVERCAMYFSEHFVPAEHFFPPDLLFLSVSRLQNCTFGSKYSDCLTGSAGDICHHFVSQEKGTSRNWSNISQFNNNGKNSLARKRNKGKTDQISKLWYFQRVLRIVQECPSNCNPLKTGIKKTYYQSYTIHTQSNLHICHVGFRSYVLFYGVMWSSSGLHLRTGVTHSIYVLSRIFKTKSLFPLITKVQKQCCLITFKVWMLQNIYFWLI